MTKKHIEINYLYFGFFFCIQILTTVSSIILKENTTGIRLFFCLYAFGQIIIETIAFIVLCSLIHRYLGVLASSIFIGITFILFIFHFFDFLLDRILDISVWETIDFVFSESMDNFLYLLDASGIALWIWWIIFFSIASLPFLGIALYSWMHRLTHHYPLQIRKEWFIQAFICIPIALIFLELRTSKAIHPDAYTALLQSLPWKETFFQPKNVQLPLQNLLSFQVNELEIKNKIAKDTTILKKKPNIYLFVLESLREDFITEKIAPNLNRFKLESNHFDLALANANGSHLSWFSIFHSQFPLYWKKLQDDGWTIGSPPLQLLKKWGYKIRLYTSAQLHYYGMENLLFGQDKSLLDSYQTFHHTAPILAADTDAQALKALAEDLTQNPSLQEGQVILVFLDATHFHYSWPKNWKPPFTPICNGIDYFKIFQSKKNIEMIKNRYKNSVFYIDSLFGKFLQSLNHPEDALILVTGDHGEEFFEHGHLFHGSHLVHEQTHIPLYMRFGTKKAENAPRLVSQIDLFPSLLHYLSGETFDFLKGTSIFSNKHEPYTIIARFNAGRSPYEFCIHNGKNKFIARFNQKKNIFQSKILCIRSLWNHEDQCLFHCRTKDPTWIEAEFGKAIDLLQN